MLLWLDFFLDFWADAYGLSLRRLFSSFSWAVFANPILLEPSLDSLEVSSCESSNSPRSSNPSLSYSSFCSMIGYNPPLLIKSLFEDTSGKTKDECGAFGIPADNGSSGLV